MSEQEKKGMIASVVKAFQILNCFDTSHKELSLADISKMIGYPKPTVCGLANTLVQENILAKSASGKYTLGVGLLELSYYTKATLPIIQIATPAMNKLNALSGQNVYLTTHVRGRLLFLESYYRDREYIGYSESGKTLPMHCTASGKAMLAYMPRKRVQDILDTYPMIHSAPNTITNPDDLFRDLAEIRKRGYAIDNEEETVGVKCQAVAVLNAMSEPVGAISLSGPAASMKEEKMAGYYEMMTGQLTLLRMHAELFPCQYLNARE